MLLKLAVVFVVCAVFVQCDLDRRDHVHRIILKPERSKKTHKKNHHSTKTHHKSHHRHHDADYEPQALSSNVHSEETSYYHETTASHKPHKYQNHHEEYHELTRPRPPTKENAYYTYPEEDKQHPPKHFRKDLKEIWKPLASQTSVVTRKPSSSHDQPHQHQHHGKNKRRKPATKPPSLSDIVDITTNKPSKYTLPILTSHQFEPKHHQYQHQHQQQQQQQQTAAVVVVDKTRITPESLIPKDFDMGSHSYEVHEDFFEQKTSRPPRDNPSPLMANYLSNLKTPQYFLPTSIPFVTAGMYKTNSGDYGLKTQRLHKF